MGTAQTDIVGAGKEEFGGARRNRTADLYNAIVALSQLSYDPVLQTGPVHGKTGLPRCASGAADSGVIPALHPVVNQALTRDRPVASGFVVTRLATATDQVLDTGSAFIFLVVEEHI